MSRSPSTFSEAIALARDVHDRGFTFLDAARTPTRRSYAQLSLRAAALGSVLCEHGIAPGQRVALIAAEPYDFVGGLFALLHIGAVPVPMCPPGFPITNEQYARNCVPLLRAAVPHGVLAAPSVLNLLDSALKQHAPSALRLSLDDESAHAGDATLAPVTEVSPDAVALIQLTSGSTSEPRGVVVSHRNLVANALRLQRDVADTDSERDVGVSWLPLYHDMGLIGFVFSPLLRHSNMVLMSPATFASYPRGWLEIVSEYRGSVTSAPNFAYEVVTRHCLHPERLDLSCVRVMACGAEPIAPATIARFLSKFSVSGLRADAFTPAYGLAEATLAVSTRKGLSTLHVKREPLQMEGKVVFVPEDNQQDTLTLVSCGQVIADHTLAIVDDQGAALPEQSVGEICVSGPSVAQGYLDPQGGIASWGERLHTGDLGFMKQGELYIVGRKKDLIIIGGRNYAPQPIEASVESLSSYLLGRVAAVSVPSERTEQLVVVMESKVHNPALLKQAWHKVREDHALSPKEIVLVPRGTLPRTSSGKLQRNRVRAMYLSHELPLLSEVAPPTDPAG